MVYIVYGAGCPRGVMVKGMDCGILLGGVLMV